MKLKDADGQHTIIFIKSSKTNVSFQQARAEGDAVGAWAPAPFPLDAQTPFCQSILFIKCTFVKGLPNITISKMNL